MADFDAFGSELVSGSLEFDPAGLCSRGAAPVVTIVSPPAGTISPTTPIVITATDAENNLSRVQIVITEPGGARVAYDGGFNSPFTGTVTGIANGQQISIIESSDWPAGVPLSVIAYGYDTAGNVGSASRAWTVEVPVSPPPPAPSGSGFRIISVVPTGLATLRVSFSIPPLAVDDGGAFDALNSDNYTLLGPNSDYPIDVVPVYGDPGSLDLFLAAPMNVGSWTLAAANVKDATETVTISSTPFPFTLTAATKQSALGGGTTNDSVENVLRKFFNPALKGSNWDAILAGFAAGDRTNWDNAKKAFDQLYLSTASGIYLDRRASDVGQRRPANVGMSDELFRQLAVTVKNRKLTEEAILEVLEVFYGADAVRAFSTSEVDEAYALVDGDDLVLLIDEKDTVVVNFNKKHFARIGQATALEVAAAISRAMKATGNQGYAVAYDDPTNGNTFVRVYSGSRGLTSSVRVVGGSAQCTLRFPTSVFTSGGFVSTAWAWVASPDTPGNWRFTGGMNGASPVFDLNLLHEGDLVYIFGDDNSHHFANHGVHGVYEIKAVNVTYFPAFPANPRVQWFEIAATTVTAGNGTQDDFTDLMFFRPTKRTIYDQPRHVLVAQSGEVVDIVIPATTQAVAREPGTGAYPPVADSLDVSSLVRQDGAEVDVTTTAPHGLSVGDQVVVDGVIPTGAAAPVTAGTPSPDFAANVAVGTTDASRATTASEAHTVQIVCHKALRLREGIAMIVGGQTQTSGVYGPFAFNAGLDFATADTRVLFLIDGAFDESYIGGTITISGSTFNDGTFHIEAIVDDVTVRVVEPVVDEFFGPGQWSATHGVDTAVTHPIIFEQTSDGVAGNGGRQRNYKWTDLAARTYTIGRRFFGASVLGDEANQVIQDNRVLVTGGTDDNATAKNNWNLFTYSNGPAQNSQVNGTMPVARAKHAQASIVSYELICGGWTVPGTPLASTYSFDPAALTWTARGNMHRARYQHEMVSFFRNGNGFALATGGRDAGDRVLSSCELYDESTTQWTFTGPMATARYGHTLVTLPNGRVLALGGFGYNPTRSPENLTPGLLNSGEVYDTSTGLWSPLPPMKIGRFSPTAVYVPDENAVFVTGGGDASIEILDLTTMKWRRSKSTLSAPFYRSVGVLVGTDTVLLVGGTNGVATSKKNPVLIPGGNTTWAGGLNRFGRVTSVPSGTAFKYNTGDQDYARSFVTASAGAKVTPVKAPTAPAGIPGPFSFDDDAGLAITKTEETLNQVVNAGQHYSSIALDTGMDPSPALQFPDKPGYIVFDFGHADQVGPVRYLGRLSASELLLDASFAFPNSLAVGVKVTLLSSRTPFAPPANKQPGNFYATSSAAGRVAAQATLDQITGAGLQIKVDVVYPGDRGLGAEGFPTSDAPKLTDAVEVWGGDDLDAEIPRAREGQ